MPTSEDLTFRRIAHYPLPGMNAPAAVRFSPDGRLLTYLWSEDGSLVRQLWAFDLNSGSARPLVRAAGQGDTDTNVSAEEALRRERLRMRGFGITTYAWADKQPILLVPMLGRLFVSGDDGKQLRELITGGEAIDPHLSPAGDRVAYVRDGELWVIGTEPGAEPRRLTSDASPPSPSGQRVVTNGLAEFIAQEEMGRSSGFWWSKSGSYLAFTRVDVSDVRQFTITHDSEDPPSFEAHRYPFAGQANARVSLGVIGANGSEVSRVPLGDSNDAYVARVDWAPDDTLFIQLEDRDQRRLELLAYEPEAGKTTSVLTEVSDTWINLHDDLRFIVDAEGTASEEYSILWSSERSGYRHLYLYTRDGRQVARLTSGEWPVDRVVDAHGGWVYFLAGKDSPLERHVFRVGLQGGALQQLTTESGMHSAVLSPSGERFADLWESTRRAPSLDLRGCSGGLERTAFENRDDEADRLGLAAPEFLVLRAQDGVALHAALFSSPASGAGASPLIVSVYGGPHVQQVNDSWGMTVDLRAQYLARQGYRVLKLDNRGSARRGHAFEAAVLGDLGNLEVLDQVAGVRAVAERADVDGSRVGVYGWSYGGYMTVMCLLRAPDVFRAGVAGAPVTDWDGYDTHYTERYMRRPAENEDGYRNSSALYHAANLDGDLLLVHGMIDENVHFRHTVRLVNALIAAGKPFRLLPFPGERHMPRREEDRSFMEEQLVEHFRRCL